jgi:ribonuclease D
MQLSLSKDEINQLPLIHYAGEIIVINNRKDAQKAAEKLFLEKVLGFDTETRPSFQKGEFHKVALLQLATLEKAYLFRLHREPFLDVLTPLLAEEKIKKVGVAIRDDVRALQKLHTFEPQGFEDLALRFAKGGSTPGLRTLTAEFLGVRLSKGAKLTNWNAHELTPSQQDYAAKDAVAGLMIYQKLEGL